jgi:hypothetical protein
VGRCGVTVKQHRMRAHDEQFPQIAIAHLRNAPELLLAARRVLLGRQAEKGGELARAGETGRIPNGLLIVVLLCPRNAMCDG